MTSVVVWHEPGDQVVWAVADTRVSDNRSDRRLSDRAAKILPLAVTCYKPSRSGFFDQVSHQTVFGFAYAGSTLPATLTYAAASACLQNLIHPAAVGPPSIKTIATFITGLADRYLKETEAPFEIMIFGWCSALHAFTAFLIAYRIRDGRAIMACESLPINAPQHYGMLGTHQKRVRQKIDEISQQRIGSRIVRAPKKALEVLIGEDSLPDVGGALQIGCASQRGFQLMKWAHFDASLGTRMYISGFEESELGTIGGYQIGMPGLA